MSRNVSLPQENHSVLVWGEGPVVWKGSPDPYPGPREEKFDLTDKR